MMNSTGMITDYPRFVKSFQNVSGLDLNYYKENQMKRRILNFMSTRGYHEDYTDFLKDLSLNLTSTMRFLNI